MVSRHQHGRARRVSVHEIYKLFIFTGYPRLARVNKSVRAGNSENYPFSKLIAKTSSFRYGFSMYNNMVELLQYAI